MNKHTDTTVTPHDTGFDLVQPLVFSGEVQEFRPRCGGTQHDYQQGHDAPMGNPGPSSLLFCTNCGDVIRFELPREGNGE